VTLRPDPLRADVSAATGLPGAAVAGWSFVSGTEPETVAVCLHGGGYDKRYWHFSSPGLTGFSMSEHFVERGIAVVALDTLGMGESSRPERIEDLTLEVAAAAHDEAVRGVRERFPGARIVGIGHSLGGMLALAQQAGHRSYDRLALLGWSARTINVELEADHFLADGDYRWLNRQRVHHLFHWDDVPQELIAADDANLVPTPRTLEDAAFQPGISEAHAGAIDVPLFIGLGERDVSRDPRGEPALYPRAYDITLYILGRSGHCHNFASTRRTLWDRLLGWACSSDRADDRHKTREEEA
jgi:pimeloyl-ACP methyl ester carboxylesterase